MKIAGIDFPEALINALHDGELVIFAGAGVSMGEPACLPNFEHLAKAIAEGTGKTLRAGEEIDHFLRRLQHDGVKVHERAAEILSRDGLKATELHQNLLRLYPNVGKIRVVTTNFDLLFDQAAEDIFGSVPEVFRAPALPSGSEFNGIIHLHGSISQRDEMVITVKDFGRAYMTGGQATRFLIELFSNFKILFIGYSYGDTIMNYLTDALTEREAGERFALTGERNNNTDRWHRLGIELIYYPQSSENDHSPLNDGIRDLANLIRWRASDWKRQITIIAETQPPPDEETVDLIEYAFTDATRTRFFTEAASDPKWIDWLDERGYLNALFGDGTFSEQAEPFSRWLVEQFARDWANKLFLLISKYNMRLHPRFWYDLAYRIGRDRETSWDKDILSRWISLLLATVQGNVNANSPGPIDTSTLLQWMGEHCIQRERLDSLLQIFDVMMGSRLRLREGFFLPDDNESNESPPVDAELLLIGKRKVLNELWVRGLRPKRSQVAEPLLNRVIKRLEERYITLCTWQQIHREWDSDSRRRSAIEPHGQNRPLRPIDVLIDAARDCLEWLVSNQADTAAWWCDRLVHSDAPLLRRLAVHGLSKREDLTADNKIDWLLTHVDLHESSIRHEVFWAVRLAYPEASPEHREALIESVRTCHWANGEDSDRRIYIARQHFDWLDWLHKSDSNCTLAKQPLEMVLVEHPNFKPKKHPDLLYWISSSYGVSQTPWMPEELLATPAANSLDELLSFQGMESDDSDRRRLIESVAEATRRDFDWGFDLADALGRAEKWDVYLWSALIYAWSTMELSEGRHRKVLYWLGKVELYSKHSYEIAKVLYALVRHDGPSYALNLLVQANEIAAALWHDLDRTEPIEESDDWFRSASSHPAWELANFWLYGFSLWGQHQDPRPTVLSEEYHAALLDIVRDRSLPGKLGRTVLTSDFAFLLAVDAAWTQEYLLPLFDPDSDDFQAAWSGFLTGGRLNPVVAEVMADPFLKAVEQINSDLFNQRDRFVEYYVYMLVYFVEHPIDKWIPKLFRPDDSQGTKTYFAEEVGNHLQNMAEAERQELWQRWLKRYWENRLNGVPAGEFESGEVANMLDWLPYLGTVFPEAVDLAVRMPQIPSRNCWIIANLSKIDENDLWQRFPKWVAKLLIYLWGCNFSRYDWHSARDLIDQLLRLSISPKSKRELREIKVQL